MNLRFVRYLLLGLFILAGGMWYAIAADSEWKTVAPGIEYREYHLSDPNDVYVARMDRENPNVTIETSIAQGKLSGGLETVSRQAARYDGALNYWGESTIPHNFGTWGSRNQVVVAINGTFTLPPEYKQPWEGQIHSGWYSWRYQDTATRNAFVWKTNREAFVGDCVRHPSGKQLVSFANGETQEISGVNLSRDDDQLILYTPQFDRDTATNDAGVEVLVEMESPAMASHPEQNYGTVVEIRKNMGGTLIPFDHVVLSASGDAATRLKNNVLVGDRIGISQYIKNCDTESTLDWSNVYASIVSNDFYFLKDGIYQYNSDVGANVRNPRTAVAFNDRYIYFIVVDGRNPGVSIGMNMEELAAFARDELGALHGLSYDGGGSSTIVVNGEVMNFPSDGLPTSIVFSTPFDDQLFDVKSVEPSGSVDLVEFEYQFYLAIIQSHAYAPGSGGEPTPTPIPIVERNVPNGFLMVVVLAPEKSQTFQSGDQVVINSYGSVNLRLGPGTNYFVIQSLPSGSEGVIVEHTNGLNGIRAKDYYWWKVGFGDVEGWMAESLLAPK